MENTLQAVPAPETKEPTTQQQLEEVQKQMSNVCFEIGREHCEKYLRQGIIPELEIKFHNLNKKALELHKQLQKENAALKAVPAPAVAEDDKQAVAN